MNWTRDWHVSRHVVNSNQPGPFFLSSERLESLNGCQKEGDTSPFCWRPRRSLCSPPLIYFFVVVVEDLAEKDVLNLRDL